MNDDVGTGPEDPAVPLPPPPPPIDPRPSRLQQQVLVALAAAGLLLLLAAWLLPAAARLLNLAGAFLCCYAAVVSASWLREGVLSRRIDRFLDRWVQSRASGFYGMMALSVYLRLECVALLDALQEFDPGGSWIRDLLLERLLGFSLQSLKNVVQALAWPGGLFGSRNGIWPLLAVACCWLVYEGGRRVLPQATLRDRPQRD